MTIEDRAASLAAEFETDESAIREDLENLLAYSVPLEEAVQSLRRKYGDGGGRPASKTVTVDEITASYDAVSIRAVVLAVGRRTIRFDGDERRIIEGELADETGKIAFTAWTDVSLEPGSTVEITHAGVREWQGVPEVNIDDSTTVEQASESLTVPYAVGGERTLAELAPGDRAVTLTVAVVEAETRTIEGSDGETTIRSGTLADETARLPFTDWAGREVLSPNTAVRIENAYVRTYRGVPEVTLAEETTVTPTDASVETAPEAPRRPLGRVIAEGGRFDVEVAGTIIDIQAGSGLIERCPECNRLVQNDRCRTHGAVDGIPDLRTKAILDDGTGTATAMLDRDDTESIYGGTLDEAIDAARQAMDQSVVTATLHERLVGRDVIVRGTVSVDEYGATVDVQSFADDDSDPQAIARRLLDEVSP